MQFPSEILFEYPLLLNGIALYLCNDCLVNLVMYITQ